MAGMAPTEQVIDEVNALFASDRDIVEVVEEAARVTVRTALRSALENEVYGLLAHLADNATTSSAEADVPSTNQSAAFDVRAPETTNGEPEQESGPWDTLKGNALAQAQASRESR